MIQKIYNRISNFYINLYLSLYKRIIINNGVKFKRLPFIKKNKKAQIIIGKNTLINSSNIGYHLNMFTKCKIYADRKNALIKIGENCRIHGTCIHAYNKIEIGNNCLIAANTQIIDGNGHQLLMDNPSERIHSTDEGNPIIIEDNVWIATNVIVLGGTRIGKGTVISAGSIVKGIVPPNSIYGGNPGKILKSYQN
jgi:acetyltransferase-like isoleucine patch superfamily enzyme